MAIDKYNIEIPIVTIIFTSKQNAKAAHASYDKAILKDVLAHWNAGMGVHNSEAIQIGLGTTDNDKSCIPKGPACQEVRDHFGQFLMDQLKNIISHSEAKAAYNSEMKHFDDLGKCGSSGLDKKISQAASDDEAMDLDSLSEVFQAVLNLDVTEAHLIMSPNEEAIAWQELLTAEDQYLEAICNFAGWSVDEALLQQMSHRLSPHLRVCLALPPDEPAKPEIHNNEGNSSSSSVMTLSVLFLLLAQRKEHRKKSYRV
ncbi:hypothetical protein BDN71DRAFT_1431881 [Pleurotus eryngii]|uniref:Uncharacterized protein n=1 Tax=Pleurotus eryngii TaxID=5323 RepID=A0A9P5ZTJ8_PLEER|nr:hypothetical protein BDN71DRAFT_1431881 [Pleurotus eryngii]